MAVSGSKLVSSRNNLDEFHTLVKQGQCLIESCLQRYMAKEEVVRDIEEKDLMGPWLTDLVWRRLEKDNPEFFGRYYARLELIKQISMFNQLLECQFQLLEQSKEQDRQNSIHHTRGSQVNDMMHEETPPKSSQYDLMNSCDGRNKNNAVNSQPEVSSNLSPFVPEMGVGVASMASSSHFPLHPNGSTKEVLQNRENSDLEPSRRDTVNAMEGLHLTLSFSDLVADLDAWLADQDDHFYDSLFSN